MRRFLLLFGFLAATAAALAAPSWQGVAAPDFRLQDQSGAWRQLGDFRGHWLVLYFYPKDRTPGCSKEAANFRDRLARFEAHDARVVGISLDDVPSHKDFADTLKLPFTLLSDSGRAVSKAYDVLFQLGPLTYAERQTFLIDPEGIIVRHYPEVDPDSHAESVLEALREEQARTR